MRRLTLLIGLIFALMLGCNLGITAPQPTPEPVSTASATLTPIPTFTLTPTPVEILAQVTAELINCRSGPGAVFDTLSEIQQGKTLRAVGRNESTSWLYVRDPGNPGAFCWVSTEVIQVSGEADILPIVQPTAAKITDVSLRVEPNRIDVNCSQFPQTVFFEALVTANGPTLLTWKWELSNGAVSDVGTLIFESAGTQAINEFYQVNSANDYWVKIHILTPNAVTEQASFRVSCTP